MKKQVIIIKNNHTHILTMHPGQESIMLQALLTKVKTDPNFDAFDALLAAQVFGIKTAIMDCLAIA